MNSIPYNGESVTAAGAGGLPSEHYRIDIQYLRAVAVLAVILYHFWPNSLFRSGYLGVDVFFVISGYVITQDLKRRMTTEVKLKDFLFKFYTRRARRLFPAIFTVLFIVYITFNLLFDVSIELFMQKQIYYISMFLANLLFLNNSDYFPVSVDKIVFLHFWSLAVEEQFYFIFPLIFYIFYNKPYFKSILLLIVFISIFSSFILSGTTNFYFNRVWQLAAGALLTYFPDTTLSKKLRVMLSVIFFTVLFLVITHKYITNNNNYGENYSIVFLTCLSIHLKIPLINLKPLSLALEKIGAISFPLYLWHWPILVAMNLLWDGFHAWHVPYIALALTFFIALLSDAYIETPIRTRKSNDMLPWIFAILLFLMGVIAYIQHNFTNKGDVGGKIESDLIGYDAARSLIPKCESPISTMPLSWCFQTGVNPSVAMIGDSHADHLFVGLHQNSSENWLLMGRNSCPPISTPVNKDQLDANVGEYKDCRRSFDFMINTILAQKTITTVGISFLSPYYFSLPYAKQHRLIARLPGLLPQTEIAALKPEAYAEISDGLRTTILRLQNGGKRVVIIEDIPEMPFSPNACLNAWKPLEILQKCGVTREENMRRTVHYRALLDSFKQEFPAIKIIRTKDVFCNDELCSPIQNGRMLYRDSHHLSVIGSEIVGKRIIDQLK